MIKRDSYLQRLQGALSRNPIVALQGPRQCGKTTLARCLLPASSENYFDAEDPFAASVLRDPMTALADRRGLIVIDEAQRVPEVFPVLRVLADRENNPATFLILGSASPDLARQSAESLAGRVGIIEMQGFDMTEVPHDQHHSLWLRGGFPRSWLAKDDTESTLWRRDFIQTFLERDLANLGFRMAPSAMRRFWTMVSHYHGQIWNAAEIAGSMGVSPNTARHYLDALEQTYMVRRLLPWFENVGKRLVKSPKIYFRDSGIFHALQGIETTKQLWSHPKLGASWEGFVLEQALHAWSIREAYFFAVHSGSELDLLFFEGGRRIGVEIKRSDAPTITRSMQISIHDLKLDELRIIYPGTRSYFLAENIQVISLSKLSEFIPGHP